MIIHHYVISHVRGSFYHLAFVILQGEPVLHQAAVVTHFYLNKDFVSYSFKFEEDMGRLKKIITRNCTYCLFQ